MLFKRHVLRCAGHLGARDSEKRARQSGREGGRRKRHVLYFPFWDSAVLRLLVCLFFWVGLFGEQMRHRAQHELLQADKQQQTTDNRNQTMLANCFTKRRGSKKQKKKNNSNKTTKSTRSRRGEKEKGDRHACSLVGAACCNCSLLQFPESQPREQRENKREQRENRREQERTGVSKREQVNSTEAVHEQRGHHRTWREKRGKRQHKTHPWLLTCAWLTASLAFLRSTS